MIALTPDRLHDLPDGQLLELFALSIALPDREREDCELIDSIGREFRERKQPDEPDEWRMCERCHWPWLAHDALAGACPECEEEAQRHAEVNVPAEEWARVRPFIFGQEPVT